VTATFFEQDGVLVVQPGKRLDTTTSPEVDRELSARLAEGVGRVVFDFQHTDYLSSAGLRVMMKAAKATRKSGGGLCLCGANTHVKQVVELCGMESLFYMAPNLEKAVKLL
jgi:anti-anti-sigma factor